MNHKLKDVGGLYEDSRHMLNVVVTNTADTIINYLKSGVENLKANWEGMDAGEQIQNTIEIHNAFVVLRNALGNLSVEASKVAVKYRKIQIANGAKAPELDPLKFDAKNNLAPHSDNRDTININPDAAAGRTAIDNAKGAIDGFVNDVKNSYNKIMDNWTEGPGRNAAQGAFDDFLSKSNNYIQTLETVSAKVSMALQQYQI